MEWYQKVAAQGNAEAQYMLGEMCSAGRVVPQDHQKAMEWYHSISNSKVNL
jgi:TPR repeat protein